MFVRGKIRGSLVYLPLGRLPKPVLVFVHLFLGSANSLTCQPAHGINLSLRRLDSDSVTNILQIHLPPLSAADRVIWTPDPLGKFSVKSAHKLVISARLATMGESPPLDWAKLWKLNIHERLKFFLWKVAWDILPTRIRLAKQLRGHFTGDISCLLCGTSKESLHHLFFGCSYSHLIWRLSPWPLNVEYFLHNSSHRWLQALLDPSTWLGVSLSRVHDFQVFAVVLMDSTWMARNRPFHDNQRVSPPILLEQILKCQHEHISAWRPLPSLRKKLPVPGCLHGNFHRLTFDVAIRPQFSMGAVVLFHSDGGLLRGWTKRSSTTDPLIDEAEAALFALQIEKDLDLSTVSLEGDSKVVMDSLQSPFSSSMDFPWSIASLTL